MTNRPLRSWLRCRSLPCSMTLMIDRDLRISFSSLFVGRHLLRTGRRAGAAPGLGLAYSLALNCVMSDDDVS